jgi:hypothetical protein
MEPRIQGGLDPFSENWLKVGNAMAKIFLVGMPGRMPLVNLKRERISL